MSIDGAKGVLFNVTGGYDMSMAEIQEAAEVITLYSHLHKYSLHQNYIYKILSVEAAAY